MVFELSECGNKGLDHSWGWDNIVKALRSQCKSLHWMLLYVHDNETALSDCYVQLLILTICHCNLKNKICILNANKREFTEISSYMVHLLCVQDIFFVHIMPFCDDSCSRLVYVLLSF